MSEQNEKWLEDGKELSRKFPQGQRVYSTEGIASSIVGNAGGLGGKTGLYVVYDIYNKGFRANQELAGALKGEGIAATSIGTALIEGQRVRRLTPLECERLQGFPDGWTKGISDSQRYKCIGNAVTANVVEEVGRQLMGGLDG